MTLKELAKEVQDTLRDGVLNVIIWRENNKWKTDTFCSWDDMKDLEEEAKLLAIREKDPHAIVVNGYEDFGAYTLAYIGYQIKRLYENELEEVAI